MRYLIALIAAIFHTCTATEFPKPSESFTHNAILDSNDNYYLFWKFDNISITFEVHVRTKGFFGFGISPNGGMVNADVVVGWVLDGNAYLQDRHTLGKFEPVIDSSQDWTLVSGHETDSFTVMKFMRDLETCDTAEDIKISDGTTKVIFSWGSSDPVSGTRISYHGQNRGSRALLLLDPPTQKPKDPKNLFSYDIVVSKVKVPASRTTYWCHAYKMPTLGKKFHMIKYEPIITPGNEGVVHHILVYGCYHQVDIEHNGVNGVCRSRAMPDAINRCNSVLMAWAVGGTTYYYPEHVGWPLGTDDDPTFFMIEVHYDNPLGRTDVVDSSGFRIYYTPELRQFDSGLLEVGMIVHGQHMIPPGYSNFVSKGYCYADCTTEALKGTNGIKIFTALPHEHLLGVGVRTRLIRNGEEVAIVHEDMAYDFNFQEYRYLKNEITVLPGDELITECHYKSQNYSTIVHGGLETTDEMCLNFLLYYPKNSLHACTTLPQYTIPPNTPWASSVRDKNIYEILYSIDWSKADARKVFQDIVDQSDNIFACRNSVGSNAKRRGRKPVSVSKWLPKQPSRCSTD